MKTALRTIKLRIVAVLLLVLTLAALAPAATFAAGSTPDTAQALTVSAPSASSNLVGSTGGAYQFYRVPYQGGNAPVLFTLTYQPAYGGGNQAFGFNLYGPSGLTFQGQVTGTNGNSATAQYTLVNGAAMSVLVQVYNYSNGGSVNYTLSVSGLSGGSGTIVIGQNNITPEQAVSIATTNASLGGAIVGSSAGSYHYYTLRYPGGDSAMAVTMNATPVYNGSGQAVGFNLFREIPGRPAVFVGSGAVSAQDSYSQTISATITGRSSGNYQLQVYNYWQGQSVSYGITVTGLAGAAPAATGNLDDAHAVVLNSARPGATATLGGNRGGAFNYYLVNYPGSNSTFAVSVTYQSTGGASPDSLGFKVYDGANLVTTITASDDGSGAISGVWNYQNANAKTFGVQVFNYAQNTNASYVIYQVGSQ